MSSPFAARISFQTFTNFIPFAWSSTSSSPSQAIPKSSSTSSSDVGDELCSFAKKPIVLEKREPRFVSKERQLERLKSRLDQEQLKYKRSHIGGGKMHEEEALVL